MPTRTHRKTATSKVAPKTVSTVRVHCKTQAVNIPLLTAELVPAGSYHSCICSVEDAVCANGAPAADVVYHFTSSDGASTDVKVRYPLDGYHMEKLCEALLDAGLPDGSALTDAVGFEEVVEIVYPYEGALGKIKSRRPADSSGTSMSKPCRTVSNTRPRHEYAVEADEDDEFEDFADGDDDDDDMIDD